MKIQHIVTGGSGKARLSQELQDELISSIGNGQYAVQEHSRNMDALGQITEKTVVQIKHGPTVTIQEDWPALASYSYLEDYR